jgi:RNA exonuclease 4
MLVDERTNFSKCVRMSNENRNLPGCVKMQQPVESQKQSGGRKRKKVINGKEKQANDYANIVRKNGISSNWENFQRNHLHLQKPTVHRVESKTIPVTYGRKSTANTNPSSISSADRHVNKVLIDSKERTKVIAMDCEMVGIDNGKESMLARVSLVNKHGRCIYDKYVLPSEPVVDYRTHVSGIRPKDLHNGETFETVQKEVADILHGRILVGHALRNDMKVLFLSHPRKYMRDTSRYKLFRKFTNGRTPSLRKLAEEILGVKIQQGEHDSVVDAKTAMQLYLMYRKEWENSLHSKCQSITK